MTRILAVDREDVFGRALVESEPALLYLVLAWVGLAIAFIGWLDVALLWIPPSFGDPQWEFGTVSTHLDAMPLGTVGLALLISGAVGRGWRLVVRALSVVCMLVVVNLVVLAVLYLLDLPLALRGLTGPSRPALFKAILKAGLFEAIYLALYSALAWFMWRWSRRPAVTDHL